MDRSSNQHLVWVLLGGSALVGLIGGLDYVTGPDLGFFVFYVIPVAAVAWWGNRVLAMFVASLSAAVWIWVELASGGHYTSWGHAFWNVGIRWFTFLLIAGLVARIHSALRTEEILKKELAKALKREQEKTHFQPHLPVEFVHALCPDCRKKLFPEPEPNLAGQCTIETPKK